MKIQVALIIKEKVTVDQPTILICLHTSMSQLENTIVSLIYSNMDTFLDSGEKTLLFRGAMCDVRMLCRWSVLFSELLCCPGMQMFPFMFYITLLL